MKNRRKADGFTVVELMLGMVVSTVVALTVGAMLYYGWLGWRRSSDSVALQRNAMVAMRIIEHRIRNAESDDIGWGTDQITFANDADYDTSEIIPGSDVTLQSFNVTSNDTGGINVEFSLATSSATYGKTFRMTIYPRNEP